MDLIDPEWGPSPRVLEETTYKEQLVVQHYVLAILHCLFTNVLFIGKGGAISYEFDDARFVLYRCHFQRCKGFVKGGAIFYKGSLFRFSRNCFDSCLCDGIGQAAEMSMAASLENEFNDTIITNSGHGTEYPASSCFELENGNLAIYNSNLSNNPLGGSVGAFCVKQGTIHTINFCEFALIRAANVIFDSNWCNEPVTVSYSNIVRNEITEIGAILRYSSRTTFQKCFLAENTKPFLFCVKAVKDPVQMTECIFDSLGVDKLNCLEMLECRPLGFADQSLKITPRYQDPCIYNAKDIRLGQRTIIPWYPLSLVFVIFIVHISFIHPYLFSELLITLFSQRADGKVRVRSHASGFRE